MTTATLFAGLMDKTIRLNAYSPEMWETHLPQTAAWVRTLRKPPTHAALRERALREIEWAAAR